MSLTTGQKAAIKGLRQYLDELMDKAREVKEQIAKIGGSTEEVEAVPPAESHHQSEISGLGPQQVVEHFFQGSQGKFFPPRVIAKRIVEQGYQPKNPKLWRTQVTNCAKRAVTKGIAEIREIEGKKTYGLKQPGGSGETP